MRQLQAEIATMRIQMLGQMAPIQYLAHGQEELRILVSKLYEDGCKCMKQLLAGGDIVSTQPPMR